MLQRKDNVRNEVSLSTSSVYFPSFLLQRTDDVRSNVKLHRYTLSSFCFLFPTHKTKVQNGMKLLTVASQPLTRNQAITLSQYAFIRMTVPCDQCIRSDYTQQDYRCQIPTCGPQWPQTNNLFTTSRFPADLVLLATQNDRHPMPCTSHSGLVPLYSYYANLCTRFRI